MYRLKQQKGFTLIELVMIIVIVAILAAIAVPKYVDMASDAEVAAVKAYTGALRPAAAINYANCVLKSTATTAINAASVIGGMEETGGLAAVGTNAFSATVNGVAYSWAFTSPASVGDGTS